MVIEKIETNLPKIISGIRKPYMYLNYARRVVSGKNQRLKLAKEYWKKVSKT
jgi:hypothetical protein